MTQAQVACALGCSQASYSRYELGRIQIPVDLLVQIADMYGVSTDYLLNRSDLPDRDNLPEELAGPAGNEASANEGDASGTEAHEVSGLSAFADEAELSEYEIKLILASRSADERAKQDALSLLEKHCAE
ncbi:MAG: helix-turn-helix transcriptional regulator [Clostridiales bacterium]|nr:helix-turn-helix transcriptional regulator [Clostridiales bacterium]